MAGMPKAKTPKRPSYAELRKALLECEEVLAMAAKVPPDNDPETDAVLRLLASRGMGFGAIQVCASRLWRETLANYRFMDGQKADLSGGEFVCSPCRGTVVSVLAKVRKALGRQQ